MHFNLKHVECLLIRQTVEEEEQRDTREGQEEQKKREKEDWEEKIWDSGKCCGSD